ncbi:MAG: hypothetical protein LBD59_10740 [Prevotellaceae bacterium]|nr:hypothetical protein [Prevotellaceae bacterium]
MRICTIVLEKHYTCQSYLEDYVNYYARCYTPYNKYCKRIHFFSTKFSNEDFQNIMLQNSDAEQWHGYEGCMVVKPQPKGIFGITYLNHYSNNKSKNRYYTCLTTKTINLFGHEYQIKTMPFMEQDSIVASCATTALWMAFQTTSAFFGVKAPSLSEITMLAGYPDSTGKLFPSKKLTLSQVCKAINNNGLISELRTDLTSSTDLKQLIYSYTKGNIPILLNLKIEQFEETHLVTVNGYRFDETIDNKNITYISEKINKIYVHDGQIGPFARISIKLTHENKADYDYELETPWWKQEELHEWIANTNDEAKHPESCARAHPVSVVIPLSPEIKITHEEILEQQRIISFVAGIFITNFHDFVVWDIFLMKSNEYKKNLLQEFKDKKNSQLQTILLQSLPKYIWVIQARYKTGDILVFDYIYDSIELNKSGQPFAINIYDENFLSKIQKTKSLFVNGFYKDLYKDSYMRNFNDIPYNMTAIIEWLNKDSQNWETLKNKVLEESDTILVSEKTKKILKTKTISEKTREMLISK